MKWTTSGEQKKGVSLIEYKAGSTNNNILQVYSAF